MTASNPATRFALLLVLMTASACTFDGAALDARLCDVDADCAEGSACVDGLCVAMDAADADDGGDADAIDAADVVDAADVAPDVEGDDSDVDGGDAGACTFDEPVCSGDTLVECLDDGTTRRTRCSAPDACPDAELGCLCADGACVPRTCAPGALRCDGSTVQRCDREGAGWDDERDCAPDTCSGGSCIPSGCAPDTVSCVGETVVTCNSGGTVADLESCVELDAFCERTADGATCTPWLCVPGQVICGDDPTEVLVCDPTGRRFEPFETCPTGTACFEGVCAEGVCLPGAAYCADAFTLVLCDDAGSELERVACADGFYCGERSGAAACVTQVCTPGDTRCATGLAGFQRCNENGSGWGAAVACEADTVCVEGACTERACTPGRVTCEDARNLLVCSPGGDRAEVVPCAEGAFCDGSDSPAVCRAGLCEPGTVSCDGIAGVRTCDDTGFGYEPTVACDDGTACVEGVCTDTACTPGLTTCLDDVTVRACNATGTEATDTPCAESRYCDAGVCLPRVCVPGSATCDDATTARVCDERGATETVTTCTDGRVCADGACLDVVCVADAASCVDAGTARICNDTGTAFSDVVCDPAERCVAGACTDRICVPDALSCTGPFEVGACDATGTEQTVTPCADGTYCQDGACLAQVCEPDAARCATDFTVAACDDRGARETTTACGAGTRCDAGACVAQACAPDALFCDGDSVVLCDGIGSGSTRVETCAETCRGGACVTSFCGDGVVDTAAGEACDDANDDPCDGCDACQRDQTLLLSATAVSDRAGVWMPGDGDLTLEAWVRVDEPGGLLGVGTRTGAHASLELDDAGRPRFVISDGTDQVELVGTSAIDDGAWHHVAAVRFQAGRRAIWVDGRAVALDLARVGDLDVAGDGRVWLGSEGTAASAVAEIDEAHLAAAARYETGFTPPRRASVDTDSIAAWSFDGDGATYVDHAGGPALTISDAARRDASCYGATPSTIACGDGGVAPWEACDGGAGCNGICELPCGGARGPHGTCWFVDDSLDNWSGARSSCPSGADLLAIDDAFEQAWLATYYPGTTRWIGLNDRSDEGTFVWSNGAAASYRSWAPGAPSSGAGALFADCVFARDSDGRWNDASCLELHRAMCERSPR